jgi:hypothetical protein
VQAHRPGWAWTISIHCSSTASGDGACVQLDGQVDQLVAQRHHDVLAVALRLAGHLVDHEPGGERAVVMGHPQGRREVRVATAVGRQGQRVPDRVDVQGGRVAGRSEAHLVQHPVAVGGPGESPPARIDPDRLLVVAHRPILVQLP